MISNENIENCKEILYIHCKGKQKLLIGGLNILRNLLDTVLNDTSWNKFRLVEACHFLDNKGYLIYKTPKDDKNIFGMILFYITPKLWQEMKTKEELEGKEEQIKLWR